ncbi:MAG: ATP synthase subunit I [Thiobacillus sp.]|uniref:ATP synthase subunit I n=1 Tax=Thiobacillus sp. TaxID=924 RepID=UPI00168C97CF|nr:ATP synthase subunit I [Thiobacillus sp.]MBS0312424.1 ATP synthase subunit I [Pseudomonadota bacterium]MBS0328478.1 ATP synthase subunit I [Pseudomonadota bacterium]QLQ03338.1 MAG: ATP synthase subunit I [Thiobacillus sp.]
MFNGITSGTRRVVRAQSVLVFVAALSGAAIAGMDAGLAAAYGVFVALAVSAVLVWREQQSMAHPEWDQHRLLKMFVRVSVERLILLVALLSLGLGVLKLDPLPLLLGLVLAQFAWLAAAAGRSGK